MSIGYYHSVVRFRIFLFIFMISIRNCRYATAEAVPGGLSPGFGIRIRDIRACLIIILHWTSLQS